MINEDHVAWWIGWEVEGVETPSLSTITWDRTMNGILKKYDQVTYAHKTEIVDGGDSTVVLDFNNITGPLLTEIESTLRLEMIEIRIKKALEATYSGRQVKIKRSFCDWQTEKSITHEDFHTKNRSYHTIH